VGPALSGHAMINGIIPAACPGLSQRGYHTYDFKDINEHWIDSSDQNMCRKTLKKGFKYLIILDQLNGKIIQRELNCIEVTFT